MRRRIFVYFKTTGADRESLIDGWFDLPRQIAARTGCSVICSRREQKDATDTWLETYECTNESMAHAVLAKLRELDDAHPLAHLIAGGMAGRHVEYFADLPAGDAE